MLILSEREILKMWWEREKRMTGGQTVIFNIWIRYAFVLILVVVKYEM